MASRQFRKLFVDLFPRRDLTWIAKGIYAYLLDLRGDKGKCWPSERTIADQCGVTRGAVRRALSSLEAAGLIKSKHTGEHGKGVTLYSVAEPDDDPELVPQRYQSDDEVVVPQEYQPWSTRGTNVGTPEVPSLVPQRYHNQTLESDVDNQTEESDLAEGGVAASAVNASVSPPICRDGGGEAPWYERVPDRTPPPPPVYSPIHLAIVEAFRLKHLRPVDHDRIEAVTTGLAALGAAPADIPKRLATFRIRWPNLHPKPESLLANWTKLGDGPLRLASA